MKGSKAFTIIELIIVIAIIVILAAIVLLNITGYINKSKDSAAKVDMLSLQADVVSFYYKNDTVNGVTFDADYSKGVGSIKDAGYASSFSFSCNIKTDCSDPKDTAWCACIQEKAPKIVQYFCVDSSGKKTEETTNYPCTSECVSGVCI